MIIESTVYTVKCDGCKRISADPYNGKTFYVSRNLGEFEANQNGWAKEADKHYCDKCNFDRRTRKFNTKN